MLYKAALLFGFLCTFSVDSSILHQQEDLVTSIKDAVIAEVRKDIISEVKASLMKELKEEVTNTLHCSIKEMFTLEMCLIDSQSDGNSQQTNNMIQQYIGSMVEEVIKSEMEAVLGKGDASDIETHGNDAPANDIDTEDNTQGNTESQEMLGDGDMNRVKTSPLNTNAARLTRAIGGKRQSETGEIAFTAYLDHNLDHLIPQYTIKFNKLISNEGNGYNIHTGVFTVPTAGVYVFYFHFSSSYRYTNLRLVIDDVPQTNAVTNHNGGTTALAQGDGNMAVVRVDAGQSVWVETFSAQNQEINGVTAFHETTFSGFLLF